MEVSYNASDETDVVKQTTVTNMENVDSSNIASTSNNMLDDMLSGVEAAFVCQTIQAKIINEKEFDLQIRVQIDTSDVTPVFVNLLKTGIIQCKKSVGKVNRKSGSCDGCSKHVPLTDGEISMIFEVNDQTKCKDCSPQTFEDENQDGNESETTGKDVLKESNDKGNLDVINSNSCTRGSKRKRRVPARLRENEKSYVEKVEAEAVEIAEQEAANDEDWVGKKPSRSSRRKSSKTLASVTNKSHAFVKSVNVTTSVKAVTKDSTEIVTGRLFKQVTWKTKRSSKAVRTKYECNVCGASYSVKARMLKHVKSHQKKEKVPQKFEKCSKGSENVSQSETKIRKNNSIFTENETSNRAANESKTSDEVEAASETTQGKEEDNGKEKTNPVTDTRTLPRRSNSVRPHKCSICGKSYQLLKTLKSHERSHSEVFDYECKICQKGFHLPSRLKYHMMVHLDERPFKCTVCNSSFVKNSHLTHHMKTHSTDRPFKCSVCGKGFTEACYLKVHERNHTGEKPYQCDICGKCFTNSSSFNFHERVHSSEVFQCKLCNKTFQTERTLQQHQGVHTGVRPFICDFCGKGCLTMSRLNRHKRTHSQERPHKCSVCNKGFHDQGDLRVHARTHSGEKPFKCDVCSKKFALKESLNRHTLVHSENRPHKCNECGKTFAAPRQLRKHTIIHTGAKEFICELCGKCFLTSSSLRSHNQTHAGYRPHKCDICGRTYRSSWYLQVHRKTHTGENLIQCHTCGDWFINPSYFKLHQQKHCKGKLLYCNLCNRGFSHNHALQRHMGLHTGERPYGCDICGKAFVKSALLQDHVKRHTEENIHKCSVCGKGFKRTNDLKKHELRHARKMKKLNLPDSLKPGHRDNLALTQEKDILQQATESIRDENTVDIDIQEIETPHVVTEQVVLTTIDSSQIADQQAHTLQMTSGMDKTIIQEQVMVPLDHHYFTDHTAPIVQGHGVSSSTGIHLHTLTSAPVTMFHTTTPAAIPVVSSPQMIGQPGPVVEQGRLQTLTALQPPTCVQMSNQHGLTPQTDQQLPNISIGQNPPPPHPMSTTHSWMY